MEKKMENEMETGGNIGIKGLKLNYHNGYIQKLELCRGL